MIDLINGAVSTKEQQNKLMRLLKMEETLSSFLQADVITK